MNDGEVDDWRQGLGVRNLCFCLSLRSQGREEDGAAVPGSGRLVC